jgi:thioredoxin 1
LFGTIPRMSGTSTPVTSDNFDQLTEKGIVLLDFWAEWCGPCERFAPIFEAAAAKHPDIVFGKVDTEEQGELAAAFGIRAIPTLMIWRDGIPVFARPGALPGEALEDLISQVRALDMDDVRKQVAEQNAARGAGEGEGQGGGAGAE